MVKILEIINLKYKDFDNINLSFEDNIYYSIIGSNNSGKTTLFKILSGIIPSNNAVYYKKIGLNRENIRKYIVNFGVVSRFNKNSFSYNYIVDEMIYPLHNLGYSKRKSIDQIKFVLDSFNKSSWIDKKINELSFSDKQLLLILIAILHEPKVLLLDNVLSVFSIRTRDKIIKNIKKIVSDITIISFTSSLEEAYDSDKIILIDKFKIIGEYLPSDIYENDKLFYEHNLEIPFLVDLSIKLKMYNLIDKEYKSMKAMVDDLWP